MSIRLRLWVVACSLMLVLLASTGEAGRRRKQTLLVKERNSPDWRCAGVSLQDYLDDTTDMYVSLQQCDKKRKLRLICLVVYQAFPLATPSTMTVRCKKSGWTAVNVVSATIGKTLVAKLVPTNGAFDDKFGEALAAGGDHDLLIVGAPQVDTDLSTVGPDSGAVFVYSYEAGTLTPPKLLDTLVPTQAAGGGPGNRFGASVAIGGETVVVGAFGEIDFSGAAYVYSTSVDSEGTVEVLLLARLEGEASAPQDKFGFSVAVSSDGSLVAVGALTETNENGDRAGSVSVYRVSSQGTVNFVAKVIAPDMGDRTAGIEYGKAVALGSDGIMVVAAPRSIIDGRDLEGAVYIYRISGDDTVQLITRVLSTTSTDETRAFFGQWLAADGDLVAVSSRNLHTVSLYRVKGAAVELVDIVDPDIGESTDNHFFGLTVALRDGALAIGAYQADEPNSNQGSVYLYKVAEKQLQNFVAPAGKVEDLFGYAVALGNGGLLAVCALKDDDAAGNAGAVYVYV